MRLPLLSLDVYMTTNEQAFAMRQWKAPEWLFGKRNDNGIQSCSVPLMLHIDYSVLQLFW